MAYDNSPGSVIFQLRKARKLTQEELAGDICSTGTISRIENESQIPTRRMFYRLLEQLGESGFSYGDYYDGFSLQEMQLKREFLECLEYRSMSRFDEILWEFSQIYEKKNKGERQFLEFMRLISWEFASTLGVGFINEAERIFRITHSNFSLEKGICGRAYNQIQLMILNTIAVVASENGMGEKALKMWVELCGLVDNKRHILPQYWKNKAALYNNIATGLLEIDQNLNAREYSDKALALACKEGGLFFWMKLVRTRLACYERLNMIFEREEEIRVLKNMFTHRSKDIYYGGSFSDFMQERKGLMIF